MSGLRIPLDGPDGAGTEHVTNLLAPNPSPWTLDGTNTWVIGGGETVLVVDPGPDDEQHLKRVVEHLGDRRVAAILLTHGHRDHSAGAPALAEMVRAPVRALDPKHRLGEEGLQDGDVLTVDGLEVRVVGTPGHSFDSLCFWLPADRAMLTGDTVLGRGTTVIDKEDGSLGAYLDSLQRLHGLPRRTVLPGHGPELADSREVTAMYLAHRHERLDQVRAALRELGEDASARQVVEHVYTDVDEKLWDAAEWSVQAQLDYLRT